jgi:hypothetical protein
MPFPTAFFPSISYLRALCAASDSAIEHHENWIKQSIRNRCEVAGNEGIYPLIVPVLHSNQKQKVSEIRVDDAQKWRQKHWKSLQTMYGKSPYWEYYDLEIKQLLFFPSEFLTEINEQILSFFITQWDLPLRINKTSEFTPYQQNDARLHSWLERKETMKAYQQVFHAPSNFASNLSALDLLLCMGPMGRTYLLG